MTTISNNIVLDDPSRFVLQQSRGELSTGYRDPETEIEVIQILDASRANGGASAPLRDLRAVLDRLRTRPSGAGRIAGMNSFVRTLGQAEHFAVFLEILRDSLSAEDPDEGKLAALSQAGRMHCIYGWAGPTFMLASNDDPTPATTPPGPGVVERFAYPIARWFLSIHIWQPNPNVEGFARTKRIEPGIIAEPPHSHPYDFVSYVSIGGMRQSIYVEDAGESAAVADGGRYQDVLLERVDGLWPPHEEYAPRRLKAVEDRVELKAGQSYYMASDVIHDVEIDRVAAADAPTITLFLASETREIAKAYLEPEMAEFHRLHPDVKDVATPLEPAEWRAMLTAAARYLRGETAHLRLHEIYECNSSYGFMHV